MKFATLLLVSVPILALSPPVSEASSSKSDCPQSYCPPRPATPARQRAIFEEAIQTLLVEKNFTAGILKHYDEDYIQHEPSMLSGRQNTLKVFSTINPDNINFTIINKGIDRNYAWALQRVDRAGAKPEGLIDLFRFNGTCIVEHWNVYMTKPADAINPLPIW